MKATAFIVFVALLLAGCGEETVDFEDLESRNWVAYLPNEETPFTGRAESFYGNGQKREEDNYKDGKLDGLGTTWYENGQKKEEGNFKDGERDGLSSWWYENGQKKEEGNFKDGYTNGVATFWYENGQKKGEMNHKDSILMSAEAWKPNGEKCPVTKIDEEGNGIVVWYKEDGTEDYESIYKEGDLAGPTLRPKVWKQHVESTNPLTTPNP